jgi:hypothetical protein
MNSIWFTLNVGDYSVDDNRVVHKTPCYVRQGVLLKTTFNEGVSQEDIKEIGRIFYEALKEINQHIRRKK